MGHRVPPCAWLRRSPTDPPNVHTTPAAAAAPPAPTEAAMRHGLNIALVGMPGSGKSTVGRVLARHLDARFVDADTEIESRIGMPIRSYFEIQGEPAFRDVEQQVLADLALGHSQVIATGGGSVLRAANREALRAHCEVFYLRATPEELYRRLRHDTHRPLLQVSDPQKRLRELYRERDPLYRQAAHYTVEAPRPSVPALLNMILMQLELAGLVATDQVPSPVDASSRPA
jgi:shikimate kinase